MIIIIILFLITIIKDNSFCICPVKKKMSHVIYVCGSANICIFLDDKKEVKLKKDFQF